MQDLMEKRANGPCKYQGWTAEKAKTKSCACIYLYTRFKSRRDVVRRAVIIQVLYFSQPTIYFACYHKITFFLFSKKT